MAKILVIEDERPLVQALEEKLVKSGFDIVFASNGQEGLDKAYSEKPDLILLDIVMPIMDGMTMLKKLHSDDWGKTIPVIVLTNLSDNEKITQAMELGSYDYLVKSDWSLEDVVERIREKLEK